MTNGSKTSVDGYRNNLLMVVVPKGRGSYYDKYGFRMYLNKSYDNTYDFRVYNFEVIEFDDYGNASIIDGAFYVSLDSSAVSASAESMFIEDVVNKYSDYLEVHFNTDAYDYVTNLINPDATPSHIDIISGQSRYTDLSDSQVETFFCKETQKEEDIHIYIQKYTSDGEVLTDGGEPVTNFIDSSDTIEASVISVDNTIRNDEYSTNVTILDNMKQAITDIYNNLYDSNITKAGTIVDNGTSVSFTDTSPIVVKKKEAAEVWDTLKAEITAFLGNYNETDYATAFATCTLLKNKVQLVEDDLNYLLAYGKLIQNDSLALSIYNDIYQIQSKMDTKEIVEIKLISYKDSINTNISSLVVNKALQSVDDETHELKVILSDSYDMIDYFKSIVSDYKTDENYNKAVSLYNEATEYVEIIESDFTPDSVKDDTLVSLYNSTENMLAEMLKICNKLILIQEQDNGVYLFGDSVSGTASALDSVINSLATLINGAISTYNTKKENSTLKKEMITQAKEVAMTQQEKTEASKNNIYTTQLQNFNYPIQFGYGSDGDLDESNSALKTKTTETLLIKAYKGLIDSDITSKQIIPARFIIDANRSENVKNAMHILVTEIRDDICYYCDLGITASPEDALSKRNTIASFSSNRIFIYAQDFTIYDEWTGKDIKVTTPYFLSSMIPSCSSKYGLHMPIAGNKRGLIDGFKSISWSPNETYKELLYNKKVNYVESDTRRTRFGSQLTSELRNTPLSNINNVITVIDIQNDLEVLVEDYQFEFFDNETINSMSSTINDYLATYVSSKACERATASVYASDYDKLQKIIRVSVEIKFYDIIERILISLDVVKQ
jgi:hypothetical protein